MAEFTNGEILAFACSWDPYGGPAPSEVFVRFGIPLDRFKQQLHRAAVDAVHLEPALRLRLINYATRPHVIREARWGQ